MIVAIDPGEKYIGLAWYLENGDFLNAQTWSPLNAVLWVWQRIEQGVVTRVVIEEWRFYDGEHGNTWAECPTAEVIGAVQFMADRHGVPVTRQPTTIKRIARSLMRRQGVGYAEGSDRHAMDAQEHGFWWFYNNKDTVKQ